MAISRIITAFFFLIVVVGCNPANKSNQQQAESTPKSYAYDFSKPSQKYQLPKALTEISGLAFYKDNQLLCVQDEKGEVFIYDLNQQEITETHQFDQPGDYEDIAFVSEEVYVLRSDGKLLNFKIGNNETRDIDTNLPGKNDVEGLTYDPVTKRLWLAVKEASKKAEKGEDKLIYSFDLKSRRVFTERELKEKQFENIGLKGKSWKDFKPSGIAFHPKTGEVYLLSSTGHRLVILHRQGGPLQNIELSPSVYRQPEGICFSPDGTLYIASEGDGSSGYLLKFTPEVQ
jgi:uncharacterized protein YjiK